MSNQPLKNWFEDVMVQRCYFAFHFTFCAVGLIWQTWMICDLYFQYKVTTSIETFFPDEIDPHDVTFCSRFVDLLDFDQIKLETGKNWSYTLDYNITHIYHDELTVAQIFAFTPKEEKILKELSFREAGHSNIITIFGDKINDHVNIHKFLYLDNVCYKIGLRNDAGYFYSNVAVNIVSPGSFYKLKFSQALRRSQYIKVQVSLSNDFPYRSLMMTPIIHTDYDDKTGKPKTNYYTSYVQKVIVDQLLPYPYETNCHPYQGDDNEIVCTQECIRSMIMDRFGKIPYSIYIRNSSLTEKMISYLDLENNETEHTVSEIHRNCSIKTCWKKACRYSVVSTITNSRQRSGSSSITVKYIIPLLTWTRIRGSPALNPVEFVLYVLSMLSTWTGISILSMNPVAILAKVKSLLFSSRNRTYQSADRGIERYMSNDSDLLRITCRLNNLEQILKELREEKQRNSSLNTTAL